MFTKAFKTKVAVLAGLTFGAFATANATPVSWTDYAGTPGKYLSQGSTYSYQHDITDDGFVPGVDSITSASLSIWLADDDLFGDLKIPFLGWIGDKEETVGFKFDGGSWQYDDVDGLPLPFLTQRFDFTVTSLLTDGLLSVTIKAFQGDFLFGGSRLEVSGDSTASVPEPGTLGLFGLSMLAMGFAARRRAK